MRTGARPYRDADLRCAAPLPTDAMAALPLSPMDVETDGVTPTADGAFEDLDERPLASPPDALADAPRQAPRERPSPARDISAERPAATAPGDQPPPVRMDPPQMRRIIYLATSRPGGTPPFSRAQANLDGEGLRYGIGRFSQASGDLGALLAMMAAEDQTTFRSLFGDGSDSMLPDADVDELLRVTGAPAAAELRPANPRLADVSGRPLWDPAWIRKFKQAAEVETFRTLQYRLTAERTLIPMVPFARDLGLGSERGLTMITERAILLGVRDAQAFVIAAAGPIDTDALRAEALAHVADDPANATLQAFQEARGIPEQRGQFGPLSHAALVAALRASDDPPMQLPSADLMLDRLMQSANEAGMPGLLAGIRENPKLGDLPIADAAPAME